jgi:predicted Zn-dependent protease
MREHFQAVAAAVDAARRGGEDFLANYRAEDSTFIRFNTSAVRQGGHVREIELALTLIDGRRAAEETISLAGTLAEDEGRIARAMGRLRSVIAASPEDPFLLVAETPRDTERTIGGALPEPDAVIDAVTQAGRGHDLVGFYAGGPVYTGFANGRGQRNWDEARSFNADWSFYAGGDKAVKTSHAGFDWNPSAFAAAAAEAAGRLEALGRPPRTVPPGEYRAYLAPAALNEILGMLSWGGFGLAAHRTRSTIFLRMIEGGARLNERVTLTEATAAGSAPSFQREGFLKPEAVTLIDRGAYRDCLVSPRSAAEYGAATNGASAGETPAALDMAAGELPSADALKALGTGVYVSNLWYLNFSDRSGGRLTGMTRFATFWVEDGEIVAPLSVMRFDDTIYRMLGSQLEALTAERSLLLDPGTYDGRNLESVRLPGALLAGLRFTL